MTRPHAFDAYLQALRISSFAWLCGALWLSLAPCALADDAERSDPEARPENGYWSVGKPRFFISTRTEIGAPYAKPYFSAGWGLPHWIWLGVDVNAIITTEVAETFAGLRLASPILDVSLALRDTWSFGKPFLQPRASYNAEQVFEQPGALARYLVMEGDAVLLIPLPHAALVGNVVMVDVLNMPRDRYVYEESYRLVIKNRLLFVLRMAVLARFLHENAARLGVLAEYGFNTGRSKGVWRVGPILSVQLTDHLQLNAGCTITVSSPDQLGLTLGAYGVAGVRYQWATGEARPALPWNEDLIPFGSGG
ncbi:MAG: hypothetical protein ABW321_17485 [Polyangiales bacterium]